MENKISNLRIEYIRATRCWRSNNLKSCLQICEQLTRDLNELFNERNNEQSQHLIQLKHSIWFLKIRCLADDYYVNESLLLHEEDISADDQVRIHSGTRQTRADLNLSRSAIGTSDGRKKRINTSGSIDQTRVRTGILTGRMPSILSRQSSRATSSYRPLTTNLTATQTAFSRSTRPLLKYSTSAYLSKMAFEYLYNAQTITNRCPDYRQCLEYLNLVQNSIRKQMVGRDKKTKMKETSQKVIVEQLLISTSETLQERNSLGVFWLIAFGVCYFNLNMNKQAEEYFQQASALNPKYLDSYTWLVKTYLRTNQLAKVLKTCKDGLEHSKSCILFNWLARVQALTADFYVANSNLKESLKYDPINVEALANVGHFAFYSDKLEQSLKCFERIQQLSINQSSNSHQLSSSIESCAQLMNNLALCNFYCGFYHKVIPLFFKAILNSPNKEVTSDIWYNISFIPLNHGFKNLAIACLRLSLKNNSQNEEATNNLGVLKCSALIDDDQIHFHNRQELWGQVQHKSNEDCKLENMELNSSLGNSFDEAEIYFSQPEEETFKLIGQPEVLYNMAVIKKKRGQLLAATRYCKSYLEHDENNYHIRKMLKEIQQLVSHDG